MPFWFCTHYRGFSLWNSNPCICPTEFVCFLTKRSFRLISDVSWESDIQMTKSQLACPGSQGYIKKLCSPALMFIVMILSKRCIYDLPRSYKLCIELIISWSFKMVMSVWFLSFSTRLIGHSSLFRFMKEQLRFKDLL